MGKKERDRTWTWKYHRHSTGVACGRLARFSAPEDEFVPDDIMVGLYDAVGGVVYEFRIQQHRFESRGNIVRVLLFADAFPAFLDLRWFFEWLAHERPSDLDQVEESLRSHGFVDGYKERR